MKIVNSCEDMTSLFHKLNAFIPRFSSRFPSKNTMNNVSNMFKVNSKDTRTTSLLFPHFISLIVLVFKLLTLNRQMPAEY